MTIAALLFQALTNDLGVAALVGTRVYPLMLPQQATLPAIRYQRISNSPQEGTSTLRESRWQIDGWATTYLAVQTLAAAIKAAIEDYSDTDQTPSIRWSRIVGESDDYDPETKTYNVSFDVIFNTNGD